MMIKYYAIQIKCFEKRIKYFDKHCIGRVFCKLGCVRASSTKINSKERLKIKTKLFELIIINYINY